MSGEHNVRLGIGSMGISIILSLLVSLPVLFCTSALAQSKFGSGRIIGAERKLVLGDSLPLFPLVPPGRSYFEISGGGATHRIVEEIQSNRSGGVQKYNLLRVDTGQVIRGRSKHVLLRKTAVGNIFGMYHYDYRPGSKYKTIDMNLYPGDVNHCEPDSIPMGEVRGKQLAAFSISRIFEQDSIFLFVGANYASSGRIFSVMTFLTKDGKWHYGKIPIAFEGIPRAQSGEYKVSAQIREIAGVQDSVPVDSNGRPGIRLGKTRLPSLEDFVYRFYAEGHEIVIDRLDGGRIVESKAGRIPKTGIDSALQKAGVEKFNVSW